MRIYLDNCCFNRPYDDQFQPVVRLETEAVSSIHDRIKYGRFDLVWSYMLDYENGKNPIEKHRIKIAAWRDLAVEIVLLNNAVENRQQHYMALGLKTKDAFHLACAVESSCECFITTDKGILRKQAQIPEIKILNPVVFVYDHIG